MRNASIYFYLLFSLNLFLYSSNNFAQLKYPATKKVEQIDDYFGNKINDPYRWLEDDNSPETKEWVKTQQNFTEKYLSKIPFRGAIKNHLEKIANYPRYSSGFKAGDYIFYSKNDGLQNQSVYYYQKGLNGKPMVFIDPNKLSSDGSVSVVLESPSNDKKYMAYHINRNGSDWHTTYIVDIATHKILKDSIPWLRFGGVAWVKNGFYYTGFPKPEEGKELTGIARNAKIYFHKLGNDRLKDEIIYEDSNNPNAFLFSQTTEDGKFLFVYESTGSSSGFEVLGKKMDRSGTDIKVIFKGYRYRYQILNNIKDTLFVSTNDGAGNFKVIKTDFNNPEKQNWSEVIKEKKEKLEGVVMIGKRIITNYLVNATTKIYQYDINGKIEVIPALPSMGTASGFEGFNDDKYVFYNFSSFTIPPAIYKYDLQTGRSEIFKNSVFSSDLNIFETEQIFYTSKDGTKVPMFLVHKKGLKLDGTHPVLLNAYGGFDISSTPVFRALNFELLENNGIYVLANIRGGGEYGEEWHHAGMLDKKQNVFDDFIAAAEYLIEKKYTTRDLLAIIGGSNGGLLIGAVINQRPDLFKVAFPEVGVMDMLRFQKFTSGVFWTSEYGSSDSANHFPFLIKYSPLHNIRENKNYPATLVVTADHDDRVVPMHSFKYAATLQEKQSGTNPVLIEIETNQGHGASGSSLKKSIESWTDIFSFMFFNMGLTPK